MVKGDSMKKKFNMLIIFIFLLLVGCSKEKYTVCNLKLSDKNFGYNLNSTYKVYYDNNYVKKIDKKEVYSSQNEEVLNYFFDLKLIDYNNLNDLYGGYEFSIEQNKSSIIINTIIQLDKVDIKRMLKDGYIDNNYVVSNKLTVSGLKYLYQSKGFICDI